ncbi:MAG: lysophospholipid acyltransferase family protein [Alphaproteobacteria bacterium]
MPKVDAIDGSAPPASRILSASRVAGLVLWTLILATTHPIRAVRQKPFPYRITQLWHRGALKICGIDLARHGKILQGKPVLFVANHVSYLDICVLGAALDASFVAKAEVGGWAGFGYLARLQNTVFVNRNSREIAAQRKAIADRLSGGGRLVLFPEGTSSDGSRALTFKSALFDSASIEIDGDQVYVQPLSIAYSRFDGLPMGRWLRPHFAWYGDMELAPHLWRALGLGQIGVDVVFHEPVRLKDYGSRKALARHCEAMVSKGLSDSLRGRFDTSPAALPAPAFADVGAPVAQETA